MARARSRRRSSSMTWKMWLVWKTCDWYGDCPNWLPARKSGHVIGSRRLSRERCWISLNFHIATPRTHLKTDPSQSTKGPRHRLHSTTVVSFNHVPLFREKRIAACEREFDVADLKVKNFPVVLSLIRLRTVLCRTWTWLVLKCTMRSTSSISSLTIVRSQTPLIMLFA